MKQTYRLSWEVVQQFPLPPDHACCSLDVNEVLGEVMFACRSKGLLHYKWDALSGLVQATEQPHRVTNYGQNCRLITCCSDGSYLLLSHRQLRYFRLSSQLFRQHANASRSLLMHQQKKQPKQIRQKHWQHRANSSLLTAYSRPPSMGQVEYLHQAVRAGDVRCMAADEQNNSVVLLYPDRLHKAYLSDLSDTSVVDRCYSLTEELLNVCLSRQFIYLMNSAGDIMLRYRSKCFEKRDQLVWRTIGARTFVSPDVAQQQAAINRQICLSSHSYSQLLDSETPVSLLGMACDSAHQMVFAATGGPTIYAVWHPDFEPDLTNTGWAQNWLEDTQMNVGEIYSGIDSKNSSSATNQGLFVPGPMACASSRSAKRATHLYAVDAATGSRVIVIRCTTEIARIGTKEEKNDNLM